MSKEKPSNVVRVARVYLFSLLGILLVHSCTLTTVDAGTVGVRYNNALGLQKADMMPGLHLEILGVHRVWRLPSRYLLLNYTGQNGLSIRTKDNNTVTVDVSVPYRIKPGEAWQVMDAGNHLTDSNGNYRFQRFASDTTTSVLRGHLAQLRSEDFYNTDRRLEISKETLKLLNEKLAPYHLEAGIVLVRAAYFRKEYETQLAQIQFNEQQKLLDGAKQAVAKRKQTLDNYTQQTNAMVASKEQDWDQKISQLDRAYQVGLIETGEDQSPGIARRMLVGLSKEEREALIEKAAELYGLGEERVTDGHLLGIKNVDAETTEYAKRVVAQADAVSARLSAEGEARVAKIRGAFEGKVNSLLNTPAGRAYVAYNAADNVNFAEDLSFQSREGIPSVLRLGDFARKFMGR